MKQGNKAGLIQRLREESFPNIKRTICDSRDEQAQIFLFDCS